MDFINEQPTKAKAWGLTIAIHLVLLLLFIFITYSPSRIIPMEEMGMEVNLGTAEDGYGTDQPFATGAPAPNQVSVSYTAAASNNNLPPEMLQTDDADAPSIPPNTATNSNNRNNTNRPANSNTNRRNNNTAAQQNTTTPPQKPRYVYNGGTGPGGNGAPADAAGTGEGNTTGSGDRGVPGGTPGADNYSGIPGSGNGISHNIRGRSIVAFPPKEADFKESGQVVVRITVNRAGEIINKRIISASSAELRPIALQKVEKIKFNKSDTAPEEQFGNITLVFKTRS